MLTIVTSADRRFTPASVDGFYADDSGLHLLEGLEVPATHEGAFAELRALAIASGALVGGEKVVWIQREETALCAPVVVATQIVTA